MTPTTNNIDLELTEAELDHVVGGDIELYHEGMHADGTPSRNGWWAACVRVDLCRGPVR
jgi:hypothetical protein